MLPCILLCILHRSGLHLCAYNSDSSDNSAKAAGQRVGLLLVSVCIESWHHLRSRALPSACSYKVHDKQHRVCKLEQSLVVGIVRLLVAT